MATVNKDFRVKHGLVVEGTTGTINGEDIITTGFTTDSLSEGTTNQYYTESRAKTDAAELLTGASLTNITITGDGNGLTITAENGVADSDTDDLVEGITNLYYTDERVETLIKSAINGGTQTNITVTYDTVNNQLNFVAENGVADSTTDDLAEGSVNLYFTDQRAIDAVGGSAVSTNTPNTVVKRDANGDFAAGTITADLTGDVTGTVSSIANHDTDDLAEGATNVYYTDARARGAISAGNGIIYSSSTGEVAVDTDVIADRNYVDSVAAGLTWKQSAHLLAASNIALTGSTNTLVIDGHAALTSTHGDGYRLLLIGQTDLSQNGIYDYSDDGTNYTLTRSDDADAVNELVGASIFIMEGDTYANTGWVQSDHYLSGFADQDWVQFSGAGTYTGGTGININGNIISVDANTDEIVEGTTNLYFTDARAVSAVVNGAVDTDDIEEGSTNLYFTDARAVTALEAVTPNFVAVDVNDVARQVAATTTIESAAFEETVYSFAKSAYRSAKFLVKVTSGSHTEISEVLLTLDTSDNVAITEYAVVGTNGSLGTITAVAGASNVDLIVDAVNDNSTVTVFGTLLV